MVDKRRLAEMKKKAGAEGAAIAAHEVNGFVLASRTEYVLSGSGVKIIIDWLLTRERYIYTCQHVKMYIYLLRTYIHTSKYVFLFFTGSCEADPF